VRHDTNYIVIDSQFLLSNFMISFYYLALDLMFETDNVLEFKYEGT
jgi:hypothetical protein